jgi:DNA-binding NtrC family response regulator
MSSSDTDTPLRGCRVLVAEDEYFLADDLERALRQRGAHVVGPCSEFDDAFLQAARDHFDAAIIDINLQGEKAFPVADALTLHRIPFVFCSGYNANVVSERFRDIDLWQEPFDVAALMDHMQQLCRQAHPKR